MRRAEDGRMRRGGTSARVDLRVRLLGLLTRRFSISDAGALATSSVTAK